MTEQRRTQHQRANTASKGEYKVHPCGAGADAGREPCVRPLMLWSLLHSPHALKPQKRLQCHCLVPLVVRADPKAQAAGQRVAKLDGILRRLGQRLRHAASAE